MTAVLQMRDQAEGMSVIWIRGHVSPMIRCHIECHGSNANLPPETHSADFEAFVQVMSPELDLLQDLGIPRRQSRR